MSPDEAKQFRALIDMWRDDVRKGISSPQLEQGYRAVHACADELEAVLVRASATSVAAMEKCVLGHPRPANQWCGYCAMLWQEHVQTAKPYEGAAPSVVEPAKQQGVAMTANVEMPRYVCHKEVHALKIAAVISDADAAATMNRDTDGSAMLYPLHQSYASFRVDRAFVQKHNPQPGGYFVVYKDGYQSFSPADAFEDGYTLAGSLPAVESANVPELLAALKAVAETGDDCPMCDRGRLRNPEKTHWPECPFGRAQAVIAAAEA